MTQFFSICSKALISIIAALALTVSSQQAEAHTAEQDPAVFSIDHIMQMKTVSDIALSPDNAWVAYVVGRMDEDKDKQFKQIFMTSIDGKTTLPMSAAYANASSPQWSPDGQMLGFIAVRGPDKKAKSQVWLLDRRGGEAQQYTNIKQGVNSFKWSPDGLKMALVIMDPKPEKPGEKDKDNEGKAESGDETPEPFVIDRLQFKKDYVGYLDSRRTHIYVKDGGTDAVQITSGDYDDDDPQWSPDGKHIAFVSKRDGDPDANANSDIWQVSADGQATTHPIKQITTNPGSDRSPVWSPDGTSIAYLTSTEPEKLWYATEHLAVVSTDSGAHKILSQTYDRMMSSPKFSRDGRSIFAIAADQGNRPLVKFDLNSGTRTTITPGDLSLRGYEIGTDGQIVLLKSTHDSPFNVHVMRDGKSQQITSINQEVLKDVTFGAVERVKVAGWKGERVESFVYYPPGYKSRKTYPTIFVLHGGPVSQHDTSFDEWGRLYAAKGYIAVMPNPHGSSGYGQSFSYALNKQWGVPDFDDVDAIATFLVENNISDAKRLGVGGWSYGGILTNYVITKSTRFAGAVSGASEVNHRANYGHDIYQNEWETELGLPWENIEAWESINPFNDLGKVTTPTLVIGGQEDWNVPILNSEQLYQVLKRRGIETQLVVYPGEHHGIKRPSFVKDRYGRFVDWFDKYVK